MIPKKLTEEIERWISEKKYGNLQINFAGGKIVNVNRNESFKVESIGFVVQTVTMSSPNPIDSNC